jgi:Asp/Glu/hydantoin racemase
VAEPWPSATRSLSKASPRISGNPGPLVSELSCPVLLGALNCFAEGPISGAVSARMRAAARIAAAVSVVTSSSGTSEGAGVASALAASEMAV